MVIAIDGPAGSGKSTIAKLLAQRLNIFYLDTGATYRALTLKVLEDGLDLNESERIVALAKNLDISFSEGKVYLNDRDVSEDIRKPLIDKNISAIAGNSLVRQELVNLQRRIAQNKDCVVEGRDITTVVFPNAEYKFYLDADLKERVKRRYEQMKDKIPDLSYEEVKKDLQKRDEADFNRECGPLRKADDAIYIDTTNMNIEEVIEKIVSYVRR